MGNGVSEFVAWQSVLPIVMAALTMIMAKWLSQFWAQSTLHRTARVVSKLGPRRQ
jgi:hypothetical protein